ncbi:hypothetical protein F4806DRAFT_467449 [Annulohypoxylon nitens]|nr:hypothetical protein F4806DRAFT_467449 [Annulohypoxylon nitens]
MADDEISLLAPTLAVSPQPTTPSSLSPSTTIFDYRQSTTVPSHPQSSNIEGVRTECQICSFQSPDDRKIRERTWSLHFTFFGNDVKAGFSGLRGRVRTELESRTGFTTSSKTFVLIGYTFHYKGKNESRIQKPESSTKIKFTALCFEYDVGIKEEDCERLAWRELRLGCRRRRRNVHSVPSDEKPCDCAESMPLCHSRMVEDLICTRPAYSV